MENILFSFKLRWSVLQQKKRKISKDYIQAFLHSLLILNSILGTFSECFLRFLFFFISIKPLVRSPLTFLPQCLFYTPSSFPSGVTWHSVSVQICEHRQRDSVITPCHVKCSVEETTAQKHVSAAASLYTKRWQNTQSCDWSRVNRLWTWTRTERALLDSCVLHHHRQVLRGPGTSMWSPELPSIAFTCF